jgi:hypothetical protein
MMCRVEKNLRRGHKRKGSDYDEIYTVFISYISKNGLAQQNRVTVYQLVFELETVQVWVAMILKRQTTGTASATGRPCGFGTLKEGF